MFKDAVDVRHTPATQRKNSRLKFVGDKPPGKSMPSKLLKEQSKTAQQLKLAYSEFYLNLVLLQNFQQLKYFYQINSKLLYTIFSSTGFRKILKKHDKLMQNERGLNWRINRVEKSSFYLNSDIESLITNVEQVNFFAK